MYTYHQLLNAALIHINLNTTEEWGSKHTAVKPSEERLAFMGQYKKWSNCWGKPPLQKDS